MCRSDRDCEIKAIYIVLSLLNILRKRNYIRELIIISYTLINLMDGHFENNDITKIQNYMISMHY